MKGRILSLLLHTGVIALILLTSSLTVRNSATPRVGFHAVRLFFPAVHHGGGGGGERSPTPASVGRLPKFARQQFTPPSAVRPPARPLLVMEPTLIAKVEMHMAQMDLLVLGDPFGRAARLSSGPGSGGGIGDGENGGVGGNRGPGSHDGGGFDGMGSAGSLTAPRVLYKVDPEFSEEARKAKYQGTVLLTIEVGEDGKPHELKVLQGLGLGLDEKAIEAVSRWRFRPALRNGHPVRAAATVQVNFRLL